MGEFGIESEPTRRLEPSYAPSLLPRGASLPGAEPGWPAEPLFGSRRGDRPAVRVRLPWDQGHQMEI